MKKHGRLYRFENKKLGRLNLVAVPVIPFADPTDLWQIKYEITDIDLTDKNKLSRWLHEKKTETDEEREKRHQWLASCEARGISRSIAYIAGLETVESRQWCGLAKDILCAATADARAGGQKSILLYSYFDAIDFYLHMNFDLAHPEIRDDRHFETRVTNPKLNGTKFELIKNFEC